MVRVFELIALIPKNIYNHILHIQSETEKIGHQIYLVGGSVRDLVMKKIPHDYDFTTSMHPDMVKKIFKKVIDTGIKHGTVTILLDKNTYEVTTYRKENGYSDGRRPDKIEFGTTLEEDVVRRDFTMNAIALDVKDSKIYDFTNGIPDIEKKIIRTIGEPLDRFSEDGLRPIRCIRFTSTLDFTIEKRTYDALKETQGITRKIAVERFKDEIYKILISPKPSKGIVELHKLGYFQLFTTTIPIPYSESTILEIEKIPVNYINARLFIMLLYLLGENKEKDEIMNLLKDFKFSNDQCKIIIYYYSVIKKYRVEFKNQNIPIERFDFFIRNILSDYYKIFPRENELSEDLTAIPHILSCLIAEVDSVSLGEEMIKILKNKDPLTLKELSINGNELRTLFPETEQTLFGDILKRCLEVVLVHPGKNTKKELLEVIREYLQKKKV